MKILKSLAIIVALLSFATVNLQAQEPKNEHSEHLSNMLEHYIGIKNALTKNNFEQAKLHLKKLKEKILQSPEMKNQPVQTKIHKKNYTAMVEAINAASKAENVNRLRLAFADISDLLIKTIGNQNPNRQTLYVQYCFMGRGDTGAYWLSKQKEIDNPYLEKMSSCGVTKKVIKPNN